MERLPDKQFHLGCFLSPGRTVTDSTGVCGVDSRAPAIAHFAYLEMEKRSRISNVENGWSGRHRADSRLFSLAAATRDLTSDKRSSVGPFTTRVQVSLFFRGQVKRWLKGNGRHQRGFGALGSPGSPCGDSSRIGQPSSLSSSVTWAALSSGSSADTSGSQGVRRRWRGVGSKRKWCWWCLLGGFPASGQRKDTQLVFLASSDS